jgi:hypothetical protein
VLVDNEGTGVMNFDGNTVASQRIMEKTILITPTSNNSSGDVRITTYYTSTEGSNWKSATGWYYAHLNQIKAPGAITSASKSSTIHGTSPTIDSAFAGDNIALTCTYSNGFSGVGAGKDGAGGPLPVELISFTGSRTPAEVSLKWSTASEINSDYFVVERQTSEGYIEVTRVKAAGTSNEILNYSAFDVDPNAMRENVLYYRLRIVDFDGSERISPVIALSLESPKLMGVYPNPATNYVEFRFDPKVALTVDLLFYDVDGKMVKQYDNIKNYSRVDIRELPVGMYFIEIRRHDNLTIETRRIVVIR